MEDRNENDRDISFHQEHYTTEYSSEIIRNLKSDFNAKTLGVNPKYQRNYIKQFDDKFKTRLIETIIDRLIIPAVFFVRKYKSYKVITEIVDGQQRVRTLIDFLNNEFPLKGQYLSASHKKLDGQYFKDLDPKLQNTIKNYKLSIQWLNLNFVDDDKQDQIIKEVFIRINSSSMSLSRIEQINANFGMQPFYPVLRELAYGTFWMDTISNTYDPTSKEMEMAAMSNVEKLIRFLMFSSKREFSRGIWVEIEKFLEEGAMKYDDQVPEEIEKQIITEINSTDQAISMILGEYKYKNMRIPALQQSIDHTIIPQLMVGRFSMGMIDLHAGIYGWLTRQYSMETIVHKQHTLRSLYYDIAYVLADDYFRVGGTPREVSRKINAHVAILDDYLQGKFIYPDAPIGAVAGGTCQICTKTIDMVEDIAYDHSNPGSGLVHRLCNFLKNYSVVYDRIHTRVKEVF